MELCAGQSGFPWGIGGLRDDLQLVCCRYPSCGLFPSPCATSGRVSFCCFTMAAVFAAGDRAGPHCQPLLHHQ